MQQNFLRLIFFPLTSLSQNPENNGLTTNSDQKFESLPEPLPNSEMSEIEMKSDYVKKSQPVSYSDPYPILLELARGVGMSVIPVAVAIYFLTTQFANVDKLITSNKDSAKEQVVNVEKLINANKESIKDHKASVDKILEVYGGLIKTYQESTMTRIASNEKILEKMDLLLSEHLKKNRGY